MGPCFPTGGWFLRGCLKIDFSFTEVAAPRSYILIYSRKNFVMRKS